MAYIQDWGMRVQAQPQINTTRRALLHLSQNENGRMLNIKITDVNIPAGSTAVLAGTKPDGTVYSQAGTLAGNTATFAEDVQMTAVAGTWDAKITVTNGGNCICTARITITIDPDTVAGGAIPSDSQLDGIVAECRSYAEAATTVQDGVITEAKLNSEVANKLLGDYYYPEITYWQERLYDTTCYFVSVPVRDSDGNIIDPYLKYEADLTPLDHAIANHTTFTCNGTTGCLQSGSIVRGHVISRGRSVYNNTLTSVANTFRYVSINADRTVTDYAVNNTTQADMLGNGAYNVFCAYYKLIGNGTIVDNSATVNNENKNVSTLYVPYSAIGVMSDNTLLFLAADGGTDIDKGLNSVNAANILLEKGCVNAWAMDGGGSVSYNVRGSKYNRNVDDDGTTDRLVHITLNFKKDSKSDSVTEAFGKIGEEKQNVVKQVIPYINDLYDKHDSLINNEAIASGTDLNTITAIGRYAATTSAVAGSLSNSPTTVAFMMEIIKISSTMSFYVILDYNSDIYVRRNYVYSNANHFSAWKKVTTE